MRIRFLGLVLSALLSLALALPPCGEIPPAAHFTRETMIQKIPMERPQETVSPTSAMVTPLAWSRESYEPSQSTAGPPSSINPSMVYDTNRQVTILHVHYSVQPTWEYSGTEWYPVTTTHAPQVDMGRVMAYDQFRGVTVLAGLRDNYYAETWEYDGADWTHVTPTIPYPKRIYGALVYDSARERAVFFGGMVCAKPGCFYENETLEYTGTSWVLVPTSQTPSARAHHAMAYDAARGVTVLFGGSNEVQAFSDTWEYDGAWHLITSTLSPSARSSHGMAYDIARGVTVLFGGSVEGGLANDTWEYDGMSWHLVIPTLSPPPRSYHAMTYDAVREVVVLYGGRDSEAGPSFGDTWEYDGSTWRLVAGYTFFLPCLPKGVSSTRF